MASMIWLTTFLSVDENGLFYCCKFNLKNRSVILKGSPTTIAEIIKISETSIREEVFLLVVRDLEVGTLKEWKSLDGAFQIMTIGI